MSKSNGKHEAPQTWHRKQKRDDVFARLLAGLPVNETSKDNKKSSDTSTGAIQQGSDVEGGVMRQR